MQNVNTQKTHYKKVKRIYGMGSMNVCWLAQDPKNELVLLTYLDLKKLRERYIREALSNNRSQAEALKIADEKTAHRIKTFQEKAKRAISLKEHSNITKTHLLAYDEEEKQDFIVTDYIEGEPIDLATKNMNAKQIVCLYCDVLGALQHIHDSGMFHLNLKPRLIIVKHTQNGEYAAALNDCGLLYLKGQTEYPINGAPITMAPELVLEHKADERSDLYSLGVLMYYSFTGGFENGVWPFERSFLKEELASCIKKELIPPPLSSRSKITGINEALDKIIMNLLDKNLDNRPKNAATVRKALVAAYPDIENS